MNTVFENLLALLDQGEDAVLVDAVLTPLSSPTICSISDLVMP